MKRTPPIAFGLAAILLAIMLAGCELSASKAPTATAQSEAEQTVAVLTVQAQKTANAAAINVTQPASQTVAQATAQLPVFTATSQPDIKPSATPLPPAAGTQVLPPTPTLTTTARPTFSPTATATFDPKDPRANLGSPGWQDSFDGSGFWYVYEDQRIRMQAKDGKLEMTAFKADHTIGWALTPQDTAAKFYIEVTGTFGSCAGEDRWGIMIAPSTAATRGYLFEITCEGKYSLWKWDSEKATNLFIQTPSELILSGSNQTNRLGLMVDGNKFSLYVNGKYLTEASDVTYDKDYFGLFVGATKTANFMVKVDDLMYWGLK